MQNQSYKRNLRHILVTFKRVENEFIRILCLKLKNMAKKTILWRMYHIYNIYKLIK
jgi:hypothetical protein